ncbi:MAG: flagellar protein FliS [Lysobacteraceae bacterium]|nr:MAG: flagellar protein FliS [Xanthomonadaceae bacterium]
MTPSAYAATYRRAALAGAEDASPLQRVRMLLRGVLQRIDQAERWMRAGELAQKAQAIASVLPILEALRGSLDFETGGEMANNLATLYDTASLWLAEANARNDLERLRQARGLLEPIAQAFAEIPDPDAT